MNFDFSEDQKALREHASRFLAESCTTARLRQAIESGQRFDRALWQQMIELGWTGLTLPEAHGGLGLGALELCVLTEEVGRTLAPVPFFSTVCLAAEILKRCDGEAASDLLGRIAGGDAIVAVAVAEQGGNWIAPREQTRYADGTLTGTKTPVAYLEESDFAIVSALDGAGQRVLALVDLTAAGVSRQALAGHALDELLPFAALQLDRAPATLLLEGAGAGQALEKVLNQAAVLTAFEQIGGAEAALKLIHEYSLQRYTFGRPIGGYQAVKHKLADMMVKIELARSNAYFGAWAMENDAPELPLAAAAARVSAIEAYEFAAEECLHLHGGIGYTWEADCHFYYKRARLLALSLGNAAQWSERLLNAAAA